MLLRDSGGNPRPKTKKQRPAAGGPQGTGRITAPKRRVVKAPAPSRRQVRNAVAQGNAYVSQGKAVEKVANQVAKYKRSRPYYAAKNQEFSRSPQYKKAVGTLRSEVKAGRYNSKTYKAAGDDLEQLRRKGPDQIAERAYRPYTARLWKRVEKDYPKGKSPRLKVSGASKGQAFAWSNHDTVYVDPETLRAYMQPNDTQARKFAQGMPLHEWTHLRQRKGLSQPLAEGGAEAHAEDVAKKHHVTYDRVPQYKPYVRYVRRRKGFVKRGQYR